MKVGVMVVGRVGGKGGVEVRGRGGGGRSEYGRGKGWKGGRKVKVESGREGEWGKIDREEGRWDV